MTTATTARGVQGVTLAPGKTAAGLRLPVPAPPASRAGGTGSRQISRPGRGAARPPGCQAVRPSGRCQYGAEAGGEGGGVVGEGGVTAGEHRRLDPQRGGEDPGRAVAELTG